MNDLTTIFGFTYTYFLLLPQYGTKKECFEYLNNEVKKINDKKMFLNYFDFKIRTFGNELDNVNSFTSSYFNLLGYFPTQKECFEYMLGITKETGKKPLFISYKDFRKRTTKG
ncbi:hypothetical protein [Altibacter sp.]|uniref:hypothetical protein n=1 Tax=Altibacter sp. TaxID=2024823 RepID=UPI000C918A2B|nr:hypothetical protein [Altibacter sp.]MAP54614.1 hypothetical protein [Altibacter sp.]|tara:strand:+ start:169 stop:507 length:339 start_codon:yes stop_codon:yes gene_type:complete